MALPDGLYDQLLTRSLDELITRGTDENARSLQALNADDAPARLAEVLVAQLAKILDDLEGEGGDKLRQQLELVNFILVSLRERLGLRMGPASGGGDATADDHRTLGRLGDADRADRRVRPGGAEIAAAEPNRRLNEAPIEIGHHGGIRRTAHRIGLSGRASSPSSCSKSRASRKLR